jgi:hypothetical protein
VDASVIGFESQCQQAPQRDHAGLKNQLEDSRQEYKITGPVAAKAATSDQELED